MGSCIRATACFQVPATAARELSGTEGCQLFQIAIYGFVALVVAVNEEPVAKISR